MPKLLRYHIYMYYARIPDTQTKRSHTRLFAVLISLFVIAALYAGTVLLWPMRPIDASVRQPEPIPAKNVTFQWPTAKQSAISAAGYGELGFTGSSKQLPMASITKIVTALAVLEKKPLTTTHAKTPKITFTQKDEAKFSSYLAKSGSVAPSDAGNSISQYDLMSVMLVISANNYADTLAEWAYGSMDSYVKNANEYLQAHGLTQTYVADASGFSPKSVSTARDLIRLGELALANPIIAEIVDTSKVNVMDFGPANSTNLLVDSPGIIGIKTGTTDEAGNCLLYAAKYTIDGQTITLIGATLGAPARLELASQANQLLQTSKKGFQNISFAKSDDIYATYKSKWGDSTNAIPASPSTLLVWTGHEQNISVTASKINPDTAPGNVGTVTLSAGPIEKSVLLKISDPLPGPGWQWRLLHPFDVFGG